MNTNAILLFFMCITAIQPLSAMKGKAVEPTHSKNQEVRKSEPVETNKPTMGRVTEIFKQKRLEQQKAAESVEKKPTIQVQQNSPTSSFNLNNSIDLSSLKAENRPTNNSKQRSDINEQTSQKIEKILETEQIKNRNYTEKNGPDARLILLEQKMTQITKIQQLKSKLQAQYQKAAETYQTLLKSQDKSITPEQKTNAKNEAYRLLEKTRQAQKILNNAVQDLNNYRQSI